MSLYGFLGAYKTVIRKNWCFKHVTQVTWMQNETSEAEGRVKSAHLPSSYMGEKKNESSQHNVMPLLCLLLIASKLRGSKGLEGGWIQSCNESLEDNFLTIGAVYKKCKKKDLQVAFWQNKNNWNSYLSLYAKITTLDKFSTTETNTSTVGTICKE